MRAGYRRRDASPLRDAVLQDNAVVNEYGILRPSFHFGLRMTSTAFSTQPVFPRNVSLYCINIYHYMSDEESHVR